MVSIFGVKMEQDFDKILRKLSALLDKAAVLWVFALSNSLRYYRFQNELATFILHFENGNTFVNLIT